MVWYGHVIDVMDYHIMNGGEGDGEEEEVEEGRPKQNISTIIMTIHM